MAITINIYYSGRNGNAKKFAEEMISSGVVDEIRAEMSTFFQWQIMKRFF